MNEKTAKKASNQIANAILYIQGTERIANQIKSNKVK